MPWLLGVVVVGVADRHLLHTGAEVSRVPMCSQRMSQRRDLSRPRDPSRPPALIGPKGKLHRGERIWTSFSCRKEATPAFMGNSLTYSFNTICMTTGWSNLQ